LKVFVNFFGSFLLPFVSNIILIIYILFGLLWAVRIITTAYYLSVYYLSIKCARVAREGKLAFM